MGKWWTTYHADFVHYTKYSFFNFKYIVDIFSQSCRFELLLHCNINTECKVIPPILKATRPVGAYQVVLGLVAHQVVPSLFAVKSISHLI